MQIKRVRFSKKGKVTIEWTEPNGNDHQRVDGRSLSCADAPLESFTKAWDKLKVAVATLTGMHEVALESFMENMEIRGLSVRIEKPGEDEEALGVTIHAIKAVEGNNSPWNIHTPYATDKGDDAALDTDTMRLVSKVISEAEKYVQGERQQKVLALEDAA